MGGILEKGASLRRWNMSRSLKQSEESAMRTWEKESQAEGTTDAKALE